MKLKLIQAFAIVLAMLLLLWQQIKWNLHVSGIHCTEFYL